MSTCSFNYYDCLQPLLKSLGWHGSNRRIYETAPYLKQSLSLIDLRNMMINLGYKSEVTKSSLSQIKDGQLPCLFIDKKEELIYLVHGVSSYDLFATNCVTGQQETVPLRHTLKGIAIQFYEESLHTTAAATQSTKPWLSQMMERFKPFLWPLLGWTFFTTIFSILLPLFVRSIYDFVIPSKSEETLLFLTIGLILSVLCMHIILTVKERAVAYIGARLDLIIGTEVMKKILFLPPGLTEGSSVGTQVARIKQFDGIRDIFTGPFFQILTEIPFLIIFIIVLAAIAGPIAFVPLGVMVCYLILSFFFFPLIHESTHKLSVASQNRRIFLIESINNLKAIKLLGAEKIWANRFRTALSSLVQIQKRHEQINFYAGNASQILIKVSGLIAIVWGAYRVIENQMTVGSLIAVVMLIWRALNPIQMLFMFLGRADTIMSSLTLLNRLMTLPSERSLKIETELKLQGNIRFTNVGFRYSGEANPALQGVMLDAKAGETIAIIGDNGSGKTTLIKLLLGFYPPNIGTITVDGIDIRQLDPVQMRQAIAYVPHQVQFFHGTIAQNLRLCTPEATDNQISLALKKAGLEKELYNLSHGINTPITDDIIHRFSSGFLQKISLARAYVKKSSILILDEPSNNLDEESDQLLHEHLKTLKTEKTILLITHRPSLINLADRVLALHEGQMRFFGPKDKVLEVLAGNTGK